MLNERHCRKLEELLDSAKEILVNLRKEPSVENGSIVIRVQMFSSAFQSFGYVLAVIDKLLQHAFSAVHKQPLFTLENTKMYSEEEKDSIWLFDVLESIGVNDE